MRIELLWWEGCPSTDEARALLDSVLAERAIAADVEVVTVTSQEQAEALSFPGSPTIRIDGRDIDPDGAARGSPSLSCRIYAFPDGRVSPVPSREQLETAIQEAVTG